MPVRSVFDDIPLVPSVNGGSEPLRHYDSPRKQASNGVSSARRPTTLKLDTSPRTDHQSRRDYEPLHWELPNMYGSSCTENGTTYRTDRDNRAYDDTAHYQSWHNGLPSSYAFSRLPPEELLNHSSADDVRWRKQHPKEFLYIASEETTRTSRRYSKNTSNGFNGSSKKGPAMGRRSRTPSRGSSSYNLAGLSQTKQSNGRQTEDPERIASISSRCSSLPKQRHVGATRRSADEGRPVLCDSSMGIVHENDTDLTEADIAQVTIMYQSRSSRVTVCRCLANLYTCNNDENVGRRNNQNWKLAFTGIPLLLLDVGTSRCRRGHNIHIILAEKGTGFALWRDIIDHLSKYKEVERSFHTMLPSDNYRQLIGLSFDNPDAAIEFSDHLKQLLFELDSVILNGDLSKSHYDIDLADLTKQSLYRSNSFHGSIKQNSIKKSQISSPCCFQHVTSIRPSDAISASFRSKRKSTTGAVADPQSFNDTGMAPNNAQYPQRTESCIQLEIHTVV